MNPAHLRVLFEKLGNAQSGFALTRQTHAKCLHPAHHQKSYVGIHTTAEAGDHMADAGNVFGLAGRYAAKQVGMPGKALGDAVDDDVESVVDWILKKWGSKSVVDDADEMVLFCERSRFAQINKID